MNDEITNDAPRTNDVPVPNFVVTTKLVTAEGEKIINRHEFCNDPNEGLTPYRTESTLTETSYVVNEGAWL